MRVLITGASGFTGGHMRDFLARKRQAECEIWGIARGDTPHAYRDHWESVDLTDATAVDAAIRRIHPDRTLHLAGRTQGSYDLLYAANVKGTENLLSAHERHAPEAKILVVSSSAVYGYAGEQPIAEDSPRCPVTTYGESKVAEEDCARAHRQRGMDIIIARPFNLAGPGQSAAFVCGSIVRQVCAVRTGKQQSIQLRDRTSRRDFLDVRDAVQAYWALLTSPGTDHDRGERAYNIGAEKAVSIGELITIAEDITGMHIPTGIIPGIVDLKVPVQVSDCSRIRCETGWKAEIPLAQTLGDMLRAECGELFSGSGTDTQR